MMVSVARSLSMTSNSSTLSTPELSPRSLGSESSHDDSFFSALSSTDDSLDDTAGRIRVGFDSPPSLDFLSPGMSSEKVLLIRKGNSREHGHRPAPLPLFDFLPPSPTTGHRRLKKSKPKDIRVSSPTESVLSRPVSLFRRATGYGPLRESTKRARRSSLPSIPSASTFPLNFRDTILRKTVKFQSPAKDITFARSRHQVARSPYPNPNASTSALVSLAWTGEFASQKNSPTEVAKTSIGDTFFHSSMGISSTTCLRNGWKSTWSLGHYDDDADTPSSSLRTPALPTPQVVAQHPFKRGHRRRWTLAMAIMDEGISDEMLMDELEKMRTLEKMWRFEWPKTSPALPSTKLSEPPEDEPFIGLRPSLPSLSDPGLSAVWQSARRALLICRELVRTERHYLLGLRTLAACETQTSPPPLMLTYLPALVDVSERLMVLMEKNPSAQGVSAAFLSVEDELEAAFVSWCGVVGGFFAGKEERRPKRERASSASPVPVTAIETSSIKRRVNSWGKRINSFKALTIPSPTHTGCRGPSVREFAILPTQRIMRYSLLFKDLFSHTPQNNPSAPDVERAMRAAVSLAQKCDRAQDNAAFLRTPATSF